MDTKWILFGLLDWQAVLIIIGIVLVLGIVFCTVLLAFKKNHKKIRQTLPILKNNYKGAWDGTEDSARFHSGRTSWGYNVRTRSAYMIHNADVAEPSWQIASWKPHLALWGVAMPWEKFRSERIVADMDERKMYELPESSLGKLPKAHPLRFKLEDEMHESVRESVRLARGMRLDSASLLRNALKVKPYQWNNSFAAFIARRGILVGVRECYKIGTDTCKELGFTLEEAEQILKKAKH